MFINNAFAQASEAASQDPSFTSFVPLILIFAVFYFLIVRPQSKKMKEHQAMVGNLKVGNKVITSGGIIGVVKEVHEKEGNIEVEISDGVNVRILRNSVTELLNKPEKEITKKDKKSKK